MRSTVGARSRNSHPSKSRDTAALDEESTPSTGVAASLRELGHRPRKRFSQSFLTDQGIAAAIVRAAKLTGSEHVLEIGPGLGVLTQRLVNHAARVTAVEIDRDLAARLPNAVPSPNLTVLETDALQVDPGALGMAEYRIVANLPYHITSPLLMHFLHEVTPPDLAVVMVQREVAERIALPEGNLSYLSVAVQSVADVEIVRHVPPGAFIPRPKVESTVLRLRRRENAWEPAIARDLLRFVRAGFTQPRKRLSNSLSQGLGLPKALVGEFLADQQISEATRPHELSLEQWHSLGIAWCNTARQ